MASKQLVQYIIEEYKKGHSLELIRKFLLRNRYSQQVVDTAFEEAKGVISNKKTSSWKENQHNQRYHMLLNFIREKLSRGFNPQTLKDHLIHKGYPPALVEQALNNAVNIVESTQEKKTSKNSLLLFLAIIMVFAPLAGLLIILEGDERNGETTDEEYMLQVTSTEGGTTSPIQGIESYAAGEEIVVEALPDSGYEFSHWDGGYPAGYEQEPELTLTIFDDKSLIAHFSSTETEPLEPGEGNTLILDAKEGGSISPTPGSREYKEGKEINIQAIPDSEYEFSHWEGDYPFGYEQEPQLTLTLDEDKSLVAHFSSTDTDPPEIEGEHTLTLDAEEGGSTDPSPVSREYKEGKEINIQAIPDSEYEFSHWEGDYPYNSINEKEITLLMDADKKLTANFVEIGADFDEDDTPRVIDIGDQADKEIINQVKEIDDKEEGLSKCSELSDLNSRDDCYKALAKGKINDSTICQEIVSKKVSDSCYMDFVREYNKFSLCDEIQRDYMKNNCDLLKRTHEIGKGFDSTEGLVEGDDMENGEIDEALPETTSLENITEDTITDDDQGKLLDTISDYGIPQEEMPEEFETDLELCETTQCFEEHFDSCTSAELSSEEEKRTVFYEILEEKDDGCRVQTFISEHVNDTYNNKLMQCTYDNSLSWSEASSKVIDSFETEDPKGDCAGELYELKRDEY